MAGLLRLFPVQSSRKSSKPLHHWVGAGVFSGLRFSTRPDGISEEVCSWLTQYPIETIELGVQSLADEVLLKSRRGYSSERVEAAAALIRKQGWQLGLQLMLGLPGDSPARFLDSDCRDPGLAT